MKRFYFTVNVEQSFLDEVSVCVEAQSPAKAQEIIVEAMREFPQAVSHDRIKHMYVENREKLSTKVVDMKRVMPSDVG